MKSYEFRYSGILMIIAVFVLLLFSGCSSTEEITDSDVALTPELVNIYNQALTEPLEKATSEVTDPELAQFSQKLVKAYGLGNIPEDEQDPANMVPDIKGITKTASDMTLIEAGKNIQDKEIAEFYSSFIKSIGVED